MASLIIFVCIRDTYVILVKKEEKLLRQKILKEENTVHKARKITVIVVLVLAVLLTAGSFGLGLVIVEASTQLVTNEQTMEMYEGAWALEDFDADAFREKYSIEEKSMPSTFQDHNLPFDVITAPGNENVVVMAHGLMGNRLTNYPTAQIFLENGYNVISYDQRSSGANYAQRTTFGYWEKYDLIDCIRYARETYPEAKIAVWGESLGGATALLAMAYEDVQQDVSALILDCPASDMAYMIETSMAQMGIPLPMGYLLACGDFANGVKLDFHYDDVNGLQAAERITVPTMVFGSRGDEITPDFMVREVYEHLASETKDLYVAESSAHIEIRNDERETYAERLLALLEQAE